MLRSTYSHVTLDHITQLPVNRLVLMGGGVVRVGGNRQQLRLALVAPALPVSGCWLEVSLVTTVPRMVKKTSLFIPISGPMKQHHKVR